MTPQRTVLILGAGASVHLDYPTGYGLVERICNPGRDKIFIDEARTTFGAERVNALIDNLALAGDRSVDAFLARQDEDDLFLGKYLITGVLKRCEVTDAFTAKGSGPGWYSELWRYLLADGPEGLSARQLSIITFNYDRSIEAYLHTTMRARYKLSEDRAAELLRAIPIIHVHGILGPFPGVPYSPSQKHELIMGLCKGIQIISEFKDHESQHCTPGFAAAHKLLMSSERILFLGFGFDRKNMERFRFFNAESMKGRTVYGTSFGSSDLSIAALAESHSDLGLSATMLKAFNIENFFNHIHKL